MEGGGGGGFGKGPRDENRSRVAVRTVVLYVGTLTTRLSAQTKYQYFKTCMYNWMYSGLIFFFFFISVGL